MTEIIRVAHSFRVLATVFHRRELFLSAGNSGTISGNEKFVSVKHRNQHAKRVRYPEQNLAAR